MLDMGIMNHSNFVICNSSVEVILYYIYFTYVHLYKTFTYNYTYKTFNFVMTNGKQLKYP